MLVVKNQRAVVLNLEHPERVTSVIPSAKVLQFGGKRLVAVPHKVEETRVLRNLGYDAPSPIRFHYPWSGRYAPFMAQEETAAFLTMHSRAFVLNDLGTGKTLATLWAYDYLRSCGLLKKAVVVTPLSTLERTWADEVFRNFSHLDVAVLHGARDKRIKLLNQDVDLYLVNHDGLKIIAPELKDRDDIGLVIIDEIAQAARNATTDRWKALNTVVNKQVPRMAWGLSGTPIPNSPTDAWAQVRLLTPERVSPYFSRFREQVMRQLNQYTWVPRDNALEVVKDAMQPAIRFSRDECVDLPPCLYETREIEMTAAQKAAYHGMLTKLKAEMESGEVLAVNEAVKASKLIQIACGVVYDTSGEEAVVGAEPRLREVSDIVESAGTKVIVFVPFVSVVELVAEHLRKQGHDVGVIHGGVKKAERDAIFHEFQNTEGGIRVLVAQPAAMSHGLTLTAASTIVWYAPVASNETFEQANGRITRPGQKNNQFIIMLEGSATERKYYQRLQGKQKTQGVLLEIIRQDK